MDRQGNTSSHKGFRGFLYRQITFFIILSSIQISTTLVTDYDLPISHLFFLSKQDFNLSCLGIPPLPNTTYSWRKNGVMLQTDGLGLQLYPEDGSLHFSMPQKKDEGIYQCLATNKYGTALSNKVNFSLAVVKTFPTPADGPIIERIKVGYPLKLECTPPYSNPKASVYWGHHANKSKLKPILNDQRVTLDFQGNLYFTNVIEEDELDDENYVCMVENNKLRVTVEGADVKIKPIVPDGSRLPRPRPPKLMWQSKAFDLAINGRFKKLKCIFSGFPTPRVKWTKNSGERLPSHVHDRGQELHFVNATHNDDATYYCTATIPGSRQTASAMIKLMIDAAPSWRNKGLQDVITSEDEDATFSCGVLGSPKPEIKWFINGSPVDQLDKSVNIEKVKDKLTFKKVTKNDFRVVQCLASNIHGSIFKNAYLKILAEEPEITEEPGVVKVALGQTAHLPCSFTGAPKPTNLWYHNKYEPGNDVDFGEKYDLKDDTHLKILNSQPEDGGQYFCFVKNKFGNKTATGKLIVLDRTKITSKPKDQTVVKDQNVTFLCMAKTDDREKDQLRIRWQFDGSYIEEMDKSFAERYHLNGDNTSFTISNAQVRDTGTYSCVASNGVDYDNGHTKLTVKDRPDPPYNLRVECSGKTAEVSWLPGASNNDPISHFSVYYHTSNDDPEEYTLGCTVTQDKNDCEVEMYPWANFTFHAVANNSLGVSDLSPFSLRVCTTKAEKPSKHPESVCSISREAGTLGIIWKPMEKKEHNGPNFHYLISYRKHEKEFHNSEEKPPEFTKRIMSDWRLNEIVVYQQPIYKAYEIYVEAVNNEGTAVEKPHSVIGFSSQDVPLVSPTNLHYLEDTLTSSSVSFTFTGVDNDREKIRGFFVGYELKYWRKEDMSTAKTKQLILHEFKSCHDHSGSTKWKREVFGQDNSQEITVDDLWPYTDIEAGAAVLNGAKSSNLSNIVSFKTLEGIPDDIVEAMVVECGSNHIKIRWKPPKKINGVFNGYIISFREKNNHKSHSETVVTDISQHYKKLHNLESEKDYNIEIKVKNGLHYSSKPYHLRASTVAENEPDIPSILNIKSGFDFANISWVSSSGEAVNPAKHYAIEYKKPGDEFWSETGLEAEHHWMNVTSLEYGVPYEFRVVAFNSQGDKMVSEAMTHVIGKAPVAEVKQSSMLSWLVPLILLFLLFILLLLLLIFYLCKRRSLSGHYKVSAKEQKFGAKYDEEATFEEYLRSENSTYRKVKQGSLEGSNKSSSDDGSDSLGAYDDVDPSKFNEEGSFIDGMSGSTGRRNEESALLNFKMHPEV